MKREKNCWIISDTHFNHEAIKKYCDRPDNCDQIMIDSMQSVPETDVLIHLGDVIFNKAGELTNILSGVKATKVLVKGNHDLNKTRWYMTHGFDYACQFLVMSNIVFTHIPIDMNTYFVKMMGWKYNVHGHFHNTPHRKIQPDISSFYDEKLNILYSPEILGYKPIPLEELIRMHEGNT